MREADGVGGGKRDGGGETVLTTPVANGELGGGGKAQADVGVDGLLGRCRSVVSPGPVAATGEAQSANVRFEAHSTPGQMLQRRDTGIRGIDTPELEIMRLLATGASLAEIATAVGVGYKTVANNCSQIKSKLGVSRTADLVRLAIETGVS